MQASFSKVLEGGSPEHVRAALHILKGQLQCVWPVTAALRQQRRLCTECKTHEHHDISSPSTGTETGTDEGHKNKSCTEQVEDATAVVAGVLKSQLPDAGVLHRVLLAVFPVLCGGSFEASGPAFPCFKKETTQSETEKLKGTTEQSGTEGLGVRMNIDGMRLQLKDDSEDDTSDEEALHVLTSKEAESLLLLVLQVCCRHLHCAVAVLANQ